jgi:glycosyltransferase involved in cell wall biosynthesis
MTNQLPRVSIGLPVYNGEKYLAAAIDSLLSQTYADFELIISDNASTDDTSNICQVYAARDKRIRYYREPTNRGIAWNFTRTFELAQGEFFKWHAHDDLCAPTLLERSVELLDADPQAVLCYPRAVIIDEHGDLWSEDPATWRPSAPPASNAVSYIDSAKSACTTDSATAVNDTDPRGLNSTSISRRFYGVLLETIWCLESYGMVRTATMRAGGKLRGYCGSEKVFLAEMALRGRMCEIPEILFYVRRHAEQYSMLDSGSAQRRSVSPRRFSLRLPVPRQLRSTWGYFLLLPAAPISWLDRLKCLGVLMRYVFQTSKWKRIAVNTLRDAGINDGYLKLPQTKLTTELSGTAPLSVARQPSVPANSV